MKRLFAIILLIPMVCLAQSVTRSAAFKGAAVMKGASGSYVLKDSQSTSNALLAVGSAVSNNEYGSSAWVAGSSYTLRRLKIPIGRTGSTNSVISAFIYSDASNKPATLLATSTTTFVHSALPTDGTNTFEFSGQSITNATRYHIVIGQAPSVTANSIKVVMDNTVAINGVYKSADASTWIGIDFTAQFKFETYAVE